jgi:membrane-bound lytic murein transglycosylase D
MAYNPIVKQFIDRYVTRMRKSVSLMLGSSNFYMPIFEQALESYNVPIELKYLPVIESALNPKAVSRVGATGLWQFMLATGKQYGLRVNSLVDDRRDPIRSSYAAARLLRDLYRIFGDWTLAIAAYNCGPQNVNKAIRRSGGSRDYWTIYPYLPSETRGYVPAFIAANYVMTYYCEHNICPMLTNLPERTDTVVVNKNVSFSTLTKFCDIDINLLRELNPQYRRDLVNGLTEPSTIRMPVSAINKFVEQEDSIMAYDASRHGRSSYVAVEDKSSKSSGKSSSTQRSSHSANSYATNRYGRNGRAASSSAANSAQTATSRYGRSSKYNSQSSTGYRSKRGRRG